MPSITYHENSENRVEITLDEYKELIAKAERINAVQRLVSSTKYVATEDIYAVLEIYGPKKEDEK